MGFFKSLFGSGEREVPPVETAEAGPPIEEGIPPPPAEIDLSEDEKAALSGLALYEDGTSLEVFGETAGLESMAALYRLDKLVRLRLVKRSRPLFMEPEVYELTEKGREMLLDDSAREDR